MSETCLRAKHLQRRMHNERIHWRLPRWQAEHMKLHTCGDMSREQN